MKNFDKFIADNRKALYALALKNTQRNSNGDAVISKDDPWFYEDEWDEDYKELVKRDNPSAGSVVCPISL